MALTSNIQYLEAYCLFIMPVRKSNNGFIDNLSRTLASGNIGKEPLWQFYWSHLYTVFEEAYELADRLLRRLDLKLDHNSLNECPWLIPVPPCRCPRDVRLSRQVELSCGVPKKTYIPIYQVIE